MSARFQRRIKCQMLPAICKKGWLKRSSAAHLMRANIYITARAYPELDIPDSWPVAMVLREITPPPGLILAGTGPGPFAPITAELLWNAPANTWTLAITLPTSYGSGILWRAYIPHATISSCYLDEPSLQSVNDPDAFAAILLTA